MKIKKNFILREVAGTYVVVAVGEAAKNFNMTINLNETGAFIWKQLEKRTSEKKIVLALTKEYDVSLETAQKDVKAYVEALKKANLLQ